MIRIAILLALFITSYIDTNQGFTNLDNSAQNSLSFDPTNYCEPVKKISILELTRL